MAERDTNARDEYEEDLQRHSAQESGSSGQEQHGMSEMAGPSAGGVPPDTDRDEADAPSRTASQKQAEGTSEQDADQPSRGREHRQ